MIRWVSIVFTVLVVVGCHYHVEETLYGSGCPQESLSYEPSVRALMESHCTGCHSGAYPESGLDLTSFAAVRQAALEGSLLEVLTLPVGNSFSMPPNGALDSCSIALIQNWAALGAPEF